MSSRSACPASIINPAAIRPAGSRYQPSGATSVSVHTVPVPIEPAIASMPVTRSISSMGGVGRRVCFGPVVQHGELRAEQLGDPALRQPFELGAVECRTARNHTAL